jgi:hypothetical protein
VRRRAAVVRPGRPSSAAPPGAPDDRRRQIDRVLPPHRLYYGRDPAGSERVFRRFLRAVDVLPLTRPILRRFARLRGDLRRRGQLIGDPDVLIAATALHHDLTLVAGNCAHVRRIPDLRLHPIERVAPGTDGDGGRRRRRPQARRWRAWRPSPTPT